MTGCRRQACDTDSVTPSISPVVHEAMDAQGIPEAGVDTSGIHNVGQLAHIQASKAHYSIDDSSGPLFMMYVKMAEEADNKMTKRWQKDADGILIFTISFSATVAVLAAVSIQDLRPNPQDTIAFYLGSIYQLLADPNVSRASILATPAQPPPFTPPKYAICGHRSDMFPAGNVVTAMGASAPHGHPATTIQSTQAGPRSCLLF
ncbi:hypothetical protein BGW80DRAFT_1460624 [Lactifluus volemus]|nr:hypothetical protein BGW80DRAFT_1460624 [Lactifluus volemus]